MSTRRRLGEKYDSQRADRRNDVPQRFICRVCRRQYSPGTSAEVLDRHLATHGITRPGDR